MCCRSCLGQRRREHRARLELHLRTKLVVGQLVVALEGDAVDQRVLDQAHDQRVALAVDPHVLEQAGGVERLQAAIEAVGIERVARLHQHVGQDRPGLDSLIALDLDGRDGAFAANRGRGRPGGPARPGRGAAAARGGAAGRWAAADPSSQIGSRHDSKPRGASTCQKASPLIQAPYQDRAATGDSDLQAVQTTGRLWPAPVGGNGVAWVAKPLQLSQDGREPAHPPVRKRTENTNVSRAETAQDQYDRRRVADTLRTRRAVSRREPSSAGPI